MPPFQPYAGKKLQIIVTLVAEDAPFPDVHVFRSEGVQSYEAAVGADDGGPTGFKRLLALVRDFERLGLTLIESNV